MIKTKRLKPQQLNVLITLDENAEPSLEAVVTELKSLGLGNVETFSLGPVVAGRATSEELGKMRRIRGVAKIEEDSNLVAM
jgi:hypothetical protein